MGWILFALVLLLAGVAVALQYSIGRNGPKVLDMVDSLTGGSRDVEMVHKESLGDHPKQKLAVYRSAAASSETGPKPVIIFVHGGGWRSGDIDDYGFLARGLVPEGYVVVLAGYRLNADGVFPAMLKDTAKAVAWTKNNIAKYGGDPETIFISGHSAGAYNVAMIGLDRQWLGREGLETSDIAGVIGMSGPYDFYPFDSESTKLAFGGADDPLTTQPIQFARADAPPMLLVQGEKDTLVSPRHAPTLVNAISDAGGTADTAMFANMDHNAPVLALASPWRRNREIIDAFNSFISEVLAARAVKPAASVPVQAENR
ncbi:alpha/beta hydrolase [Pontixanthobacter aquaemixtae]|uniref:Alpha/beta hydrolase fold domain-containing protein n=1 Tax=Pontixanthobacter aquaemixtae TaxID=1958940 RepID=A0A844ZUR9_9SPHN|nr:alpha/beta hydrolase [Pontixanthobacter aquaemixtae]MXO91488.1 alpha/beta hydrolase fold domain-containing protein [Pontixanthobacter aquaemixtae]